MLHAGESGIWKTFILEEFARRTKQRGIRVSAGVGPPLSPDRASSASGEPLHAFRGVLQVVADLSMAGGPDTTERLLGNRLALLARYEQSVQSLLPEGTGEPAALPASAARERVLAAMRDTIGALLATGPCVVVLDDLQWADDLTLGLLAELCRGFVQANPLLVVGAYRVEEADEDLLRVTGLVENVPLTQLDRVSLNSMVADMLSASEPPERFNHGGPKQGRFFEVSECFGCLCALDENAARPEDDALGPSPRSILAP